MLLKIVFYILLFFIILLLGPSYLLLSGHVSLGKDWRTASRAPAHILQYDAIGKQAAIVLFSAPAFNWRGMFSTHTWLAVKTQQQTQFTIYQVVGWNRYRHKPIVDISHGIADRLWFGAKPKLQNILVGRKAQSLIPLVQNAVKSYPYANTYRAWPGPNSNTFISYIIHQVPKLGFVMPYNALGRNYGWHWTINSLALGGILGYQANHHALAINLLGLTVGISWRPLGLIVPGVGLI